MLQLANPNYCQFIILMSLNMQVQQEALWINLDILSVVEESLMLLKKIRGNTILSLILCGLQALVYLSVQKTFGMQEPLTDDSLRIMKKLTYVGDLGLKEKGLYVFLIVKYIM